MFYGHVFERYVRECPGESFHNVLRLWTIIYDLLHLRAIVLGCFFYHIEIIAKNVEFYIFIDLMYYLKGTQII